MKIVPESASTGSVESNYNEENFRGDAPSIEERMSQLIMDKDGVIALPAELRARHGFSSETPIRVIETRTGLLLVPLGKEPMSAALCQELAEWQALSSSTWDLFPFEEKQ